MRSTIKALVGTLSLMLLLACAQRRREPEPPAKDPQEAATRALETLKGLVTAQNYKAMGFESQDEVKAATLGEPLAVFHIPLDQLREYQVATDPNKLLTDVSQIMYPVLAREQVRSSVVVARMDDSWKGGQFGGANVIKALTRARSSDAATAGQGIRGYFAVRVPALNLYFVGRHTEGKLLLTPALDDPIYNFKAGVSMPGEQVLRKLVEAAKRYNGLPI